MSDGEGFLAGVPKWCLHCNAYFEESVQDHGEGGHGQWDYIRLDTNSPDDIPGAVGRRNKGRTEDHPNDEIISAIESDERASSALRSGDD